MREKLILYLISHLRDERGLSGNDVSNPCWRTELIWDFSINGWSWFWLLRTTNCKKKALKLPYLFFKPFFLQYQADTFLKNLWPKRLCCTPLVFSFWLSCAFVVKTPAPLHLWFAPHLLHLRPPHPLPQSCWSCGVHVVEKTETQLVVNLFLHLPSSRNNHWRSGFSYEQRDMKTIPHEYARDDNINNKQTKKNPNLT